MLIINIQIILSYYVFFFFNYYFLEDISIGEGIFSTYGYKSVISE